MECYKKLISTEKESLLRTHRKTCILRKVLAAFAAVILATVFTIPAFASGGLELSTRYTGIYAKPGDTLNFDLDFSNYSDSVLDVTLSAAGLPEHWTGSTRGLRTTFRANFSARSSGGRSPGITDGSKRTPGPTDVRRNTMPTAGRISTSVRMTGIRSSRIWKPIRPWSGSWRSNRTTVITGSWRQKRNPAGSTAITPPARTETDRPDFGENTGGEARRADRKGTRFRSGNLTRLRGTPDSAKKASISAV